MTRRSARPELLLGAGALVSRILGFAKALLLVMCIGGTTAAPGGQIFDVANTLPTALYALIAGGALSSILVPEIAGALRREGVASGDSREHVSQIVSLTTYLALALTAFMLVLAPVLVNAYASAWPDSWLRLGAAMALWCIPQVFFLVQYGTLSQILLAHGRFGYVAWAPALSNAVVICTLFAFLTLVPSGLVGVEEWTPTMVGILCGGATLGAVAQFALIGAPVAALGYRLRLRLRLRRLAHVGIGVVWGFLGVACWQGSYVVVSNVASAAGAALTIEGVDGASLNSLSAAYLLFLVPHGVMALSLITASYSRISLSLATGDVYRGWADACRTARRVVFVSAFFTALFIAIGPAIGATVWGAQPIGEVLQALGWGLAPFSLTVLIQRLFYAVGAVRAPVVVQSVVALLTVVGTLLVGAWISADHVVVGIAAVTSLATWAGLIVALVLLHRSPAFRDSVTASGRPAIAGALRATAVAIGAGVCARVAWDHLPRSGMTGPVEAVMHLVGATACALIVFFAIGILVRDSTASEAWRLCHSRRGAR
ncbi:lipid II flippase MurJ [Herbiconiux sp. KACC 21604]|uniref:murein biosynthesis integral membrane protein MurJ n=1 Tax=unclassified Herbiconiux TaxID=2618217 RepID=UPI00149151E8|nr:lipid II flippase MurJ [Herbiconiux sp. SALV-R1]QJU52779.1 hypothetical protein HL652_03400 [Herbiconiux sp. SALV-R1]WPO87685.1 lipid II flippase MurJ [Herbiconiux sp. KACC 21604]